MTRTRRRTVVSTIGAVLALITTGCVGPSPSEPTPGGGSGWATATSAQSGGGMNALVAAAKAEGRLTVIALSPDWVNYGSIIREFTARYGIAVDSVDPTGSSQDEIDTVKRLGRQAGAPDVLDLGPAFAAENTALLAPFKVATWNTIEAKDKHPDGAWVNDYGGYISIGCNTAVVASCPSTIAALARPEYRGQVAINGDPTRAAAALASVWAAALAGGGSFDDITPGIAFFGRLARTGNLQRIDPDRASIASGRTPIVLDWDYLNIAETASNPAGATWKVTVPADGLFAQFYAQAINRNAPHPAAARLWQEFLYSDEGQNLWLAGRARPVRLVAMTSVGTADKALVAALPPVAGRPGYPTGAQIDAATTAVARGWAAATS